jgi:hypothetical protein
MSQKTKTTLKTKSNKKRTYNFSPFGNNSKKLNNNKTIFNFDKYIDKDDIDDTYNDIIPENDHLKYNNKTIFNFHNYIAKDNIDTTYKDTIPENDSIVYFLILSHGSVNYYKNKPEYIRTPKKEGKSIDYFNKITYAPLGFSNYGTDDEYMLNSITTKINKFINEKKYPLVNNELIEVLPNVDCVLEMQRESLKKLKNASTVSDMSYKCGLKNLSDREPKLYGSVVYSKGDYDCDDDDKDGDDDDNCDITTEIINKSFSIGKNDSEHMNIYVVFAKGGKLNTGDKVLNSDKYLKYLANWKIEMRKEWYDDWRNRGRINEDEYEEKIIEITNKAYEEEIENINDVTSEELLKFARYCGYKNVIMIDYSCDVCINHDGEKVPRNLVMATRNDFHPFHGRGIHKKLKKTKKHISRKLKQNRKSKKYKKM